MRSGEQAKQTKERGREEVGGEREKGVGRDSDRKTDRDRQTDGNGGRERQTEGMHNSNNSVKKEKVILRPMVNIDIACCVVEKMGKICMKKIRQLTRGDERS